MSKPDLTKPTRQELRGFLVILVFEVQNNFVIIKFYFKTILMEHVLNGLFYADASIFPIFNVK